MSELLKQIQNGRLAIDELDHFYIEAKKVIAICEKIRSLFFPEYFPLRESEADTLEEIRYQLDRQILRVDMDHEKTTDRFMKQLPKIQQVLYEDLKAIYNGDPSAKTFTEIILSFPGFQATFLYRIAHELYELDVLIDHLTQYRDAMEQEDSAALCRLLDEGRRIKEEVDGK